MCSSPLQVGGSSRPVIIDYFATWCVGGVGNWLYTPPVGLGYT